MSPIQNGAYLDEQVFPEPSWCVPGIIPEGCCILSGHPKIGKSFLVLAVAHACASGGTVLGVEVERRPVLYLALEDDAKRLQHRSRILLDEGPLPEQFNYLTRDEWAQAMELAKVWVEAHEHRKPLVIVDTLEEKIRGPRSQNSYADDYKAGTSLQSLLAEGGTVIAVHHNRKGESEDFFDAVSGTLALAGSVDTVITLNRTRGVHRARSASLAAMSMRWSTNSISTTASGPRTVRTWPKQHTARPRTSWVRTCKMPWTSSILAR